MSIKIKEIGVIVQLENGDVHQVILSNYQKEVISSIIFNGDKIKLNEEKITQINFELCEVKS